MGLISLYTRPNIYFAHRRERVSSPFGKKLIAGALLRSAARPTAADRRINHFAATLPPAPETQYFCSCALFNESRPEICGPRSDGVHVFLHFARPETLAISMLLAGLFRAAHAKQQTTRAEMEFWAKKEKKRVSRRSSKVIIHRCIVRGICK